MRTLLPSLLLSCLLVSLGACSDGPVATPDGWDGWDGSDAAAEVSPDSGIDGQDADAEVPGNDVLDASVDPDGAFDGISDGTSGTDAEVDTTPEPPPGEATFEPGQVLQIEVTLPALDWSALRAQGRNLYDILPPNCLDSPVTKPFTWFDATVTINGDTLASVGVRKKGFLGSLSGGRPSLKLRFDKYVADQRYDGLKRMTLNNNRQDISRLNTCLAYDVMRKAGVPSPRCNYAHVTVNGESLGVYSHVDSMKKPFLRQHFTDDEGTLYEGQLADFRTGWTGNLENKTVDDAGPGPEIFAIVTALETAADEEIVSALAPLIDLDAFVTFWAAEILVSHWDGFAGDLNNYYVYSDPTSGKLHFLPWGPDATFSGNVDLFGGNQVPQSVMAQSQLTRRLYADPSVRGQYVTELERQLDEAWDETALLAEVDTRRALIAPYVLPANAEFEVDVLRLKDFINARRGQINDELAVGVPEWTIELRSPPCWSPNGSASATAVTTYGTLTQNNIFAAGSGTLSVTAPGIPSDVSLVGSKGGPAVEPYNTATRTTLQVGAQRANGTYFLILVEAPTAMLMPGVYLPFDMETTDAYLASLSATFELEIVGRFYTGGLTIGAYDGLDGGDLEFSLTGDLFGPKAISEGSF